MLRDNLKVEQRFVTECLKQLRGSRVTIIDLRVLLLRSFGHKSPFHFANESYPDPFPLIFRLHSEMVDPTTSSVPTAYYTTHDLIDLFSNEEQIWVSLEFQPDIFKFVSRTQNQARRLPQRAYCVVVLDLEFTDLHDLLSIRFVQSSCL